MVLLVHFKFHMTFNSNLSKDTKCRVTHRKLINALKESGIYNETVVTKIGTIWQNLDSVYLSRTKFNLNQLLAEDVWM
jgi:hypothetical protein